MTDRLTSLDASFLYMEEPTTPMHVGEVSVFQAPADGFDYDRLFDLVEARLGFVPRYRQRVRQVPGPLAAPVWVDDEAFDLSYHLRRSALPRPGTDEQLHELVARVLSRPLDHTRPLWECYLVEGLAGGRFAVITKTHQAMIDGIAAVDIGQVLLDTDTEPEDVAAPVWAPRPGPSSVRLVADATVEMLQRPTAAFDAVRQGVGDVSRTIGRLGAAAGGALLMARVVTSAPASPLNAEIGEARRFATMTADLADLRAVRKVHGCDVNDVVLTVVTGGLRHWLQTRGEPVTARASVRALVPVSVTDDEDGGDEVASFVVELPVGEPSPVVRLHQVSYGMRALLESRRTVAAESLAGIAGFAPPTLHALGARVASGLSRRVFNVVVTNVPGPQRPMFAAGARMLESYPVVPLAKGQALSIGVTSYDGQVFFGLYGDRAAMADLDVLAQTLRDALDELVAASR